MGRILKRVKRMYFDLLVNSIASSKVIPKELRVVIYKIHGIKLKTSSINPGCFFGGNNIKIGKDTFINYNCFIDNSASVEIGENCNLAMEVLICTATHKIGSFINRASKAIGKPIIIKDGCWIGARATILPGVTIEQGCIIAAGSVVIKDCEANGLYAGIPARRIKNLNEAGAS